MFWGDTEMLDGKMTVRVPLFFQPTHKGYTNINKLTHPLEPRG